MNGVFISGTDTDVGKTVVSAILALHTSQILPSVHYQKPIQTGGDINSDVTIVKSLVGLQKNIICTQGLIFQKPLSPHIAAHLEQTHIDFNNVVENVIQNADHHFNVIEGAGGLLVPINNSKLMIDLIKSINLPCILVARSGLGTINHTLLSIEAIRQRGIKILGIAMVGARNLENERSVQYYGKIANILSIPPFAQLDHSHLAHFVEEKRAELTQFLLRAHHDQTNH